MGYVILLAILFGIVCFILENLKVIGIIVCIVAAIVIYSFRMRKTYAIYTGNYESTSYSGGENAYVSISSNYDQTQYYGTYHPAIPGDLVTKNYDCFKLPSGNSIKFETRNRKGSFLTENQEWKYGILKHNGTSYSFKVSENQTEAKRLFELAESDHKAKEKTFLKYGWYIYDIILLVMSLLTCFTDILSDSEFPLIDIVAFSHIIMTVLRGFLWKDTDWKDYTRWFLGDIFVCLILLVVGNFLLSGAISFFTVIAWMVLSVISLFSYIYKNISKKRWK